MYFEFLQEIRFTRGNTTNHLVIYINNVNNYLQYGYNKIIWIVICEAVGESFYNYGTGGGGVT